MATWSNIPVPDDIEECAVLFQKWVRFLGDSHFMHEIGKIAMRKAQEENRRLGLPNVYEDKNRRIYYELPDGTITYECPFKKNEDK